LNITLYLAYLSNFFSPDLLPRYYKDESYIKTILVSYEAVCVQK